MSGSRTSKDRQLWTVGHSTRSIDELIDLLRVHAIALLVDVRRYPASRRHPHFNEAALAESLMAAGIAYQHLPELGGRRSAHPNSVNLGWRSAGFRGYADYMQTDEFWRALEELVAYGKKRPAAIMCAEAVPWRCHRSLIADALVSRSWTVQHILTTAEAQPHQLTAFAKIQNGVLTYPEPAAQEPTPWLL